MEYIFGIFLALIIAGGAYAETVVIDNVMDGDSLFVVKHLEDGTNKRLSVHLINADSPEYFPGVCKTAEQVAKRAQERARALMPVGTEVELKNITKEAFSEKIFANVVLSDGRDVGQILIKENLAHTFDGKNRKDWCK